VGERLGGKDGSAEGAPLDAGNDGSGMSFGSGAFGGIGGSDEPIGACVGGSVSTAPIVSASTSSASSPPRGLAAAAVAAGGAAGVRLLGGGGSGNVRAGASPLTTTLGAGAAWAGEERGGGATGWCETGPDGTRGGGGGTALGGRSVAVGGRTGSGGVTPAEVERGTGGVGGFRGCGCAGRCAPGEDVDVRRGTVGGAFAGVRPTA
jgi:hypothetical protein